MNTQSLLAFLRELNIKLWVEDDRLRVDAPKGVLTPELRDELAQRKADIISFLRPATAQVENVNTAPLELVNRDQPLPLSFGQQRLWFFDQLVPGNPVYNIYTGLHFQEELNVLALEETLNEIIRRQESLRTIFPIIDGLPVQHIVPFQPRPLQIIDLCHLPDAERESELRRIATHESRRSFDLTQGPLFRAMLVQLREAEYHLLLNIHHIIADGWSVGLIFRELRAIYPAISAGESSPLWDLRVQYVDYAAWQREWLNENGLKSQLEYWKKQLAGPLPVLELPSDHPRPKIQSFQGASHTFTVPMDIVNRLKALGQRAEATLFMTLLAAFKVLLFRYTGQPDLLVGTPVAGRTRIETERLIGLFVNMLVLRTDLTDNPSFLQLLARIRNTSLDAFAHQDVPFEHLVEVLQPARDATHTPLFQMMFVYDKVQAIPLETDNSTAKFDLTLYFWEGTDRLTARLEYSTDLFEAATIQRMGRHLLTLLEAITSNPDERIASLPLLAEADMQLLNKWNETEQDYPRQSCLHQLFEKQAAQTPDKIAVMFENEQVTYRQLNQRANQLARYLQTLGVGTETPVGLSMARSAEMVVALLGILKSGGTYIPLDPLFPQNRLDFMLEASQTRILVTRGNSSSQPASIQVVDLDRDWSLISQYGVENLPNNTQPHHLAYTLFTSGSTGKPKGVQIPHRAVVNFLTSMRRTPGLTADDRLLSVTTLSFDISVLEVFLPLTTGACVTIAPGDSIHDGAALIQQLQKGKITVMQATPATWQMLISAGWQGEKKLKVLCGGESMSRDLAEWLTKHTASVWNMYGPTETTVWSTLSEITRDTPRVTIGRPIANTRIYILDQDLVPVPIGVAGELFIAGDGVACGYLNQPELSVERFLPDPFQKNGSRMYKTGDQARFLQDGNIDFIGRTDFQIKIRGFRIELGEIETVLNNHPEISQALVMAREDSPGDKRLVAYLISKTSTRPDPGELRQFIRTKLPEYMLPSFFVFLDEFPMTPNRKVNRKALPVPEQGGRGLEHEQVPARNDTEKKLVQIWEDLLKVKPIGVTDNFFELGGHSLQAVYLFACIHQQFGIQLPLATLFQEATIEQIANVIRRTKVSEIWSSLIEIEPQGNHPPFFCIHGITGDVLWFRDLARTLAPDYPFYGLQARGLDGIQEPFSRIEPMATCYIDEIRRLQPRGPYFLGGASFGGTVAYEIAQQLQEQGEEVALLAIFDQPPPNVSEDHGHGSIMDEIGRILMVIKNFPGWFREFIELDPSRMLLRVRRKARLARKIRAQSRSLDSRAFNAADFIDSADTFPLHRQQLIMRHYQAVLAYQPRPFSGRVTLFRATTRPFSSTFDPVAGWRELVPGRLEVIDVPGSHEGMFKKPHVAYVATRLKRCLDGKADQK